MKRSLSGIQPSGILHLGNYFGAMKQFIDAQNSGEYDGFYFIADYHSLTSLTDPKALKDNTYNIVLDYLALGLDPNKSTIFLQSDIPEHVELSWLLSNVTPVGLLERGHSYKDKIAKGIFPNTGLLTYPVLMAADILMYDADVVPVGKDQKQHLEMTRDIAMKFNQQYGVELFKLPEPLTLDDSAVVPGVDGQKMSKSLGNFMLADEVLENYDSEVIRYAILVNHYTSTQDLGNEALKNAEKSLYYFYNSLDSSVQNSIVSNTFNVCFRYK